MNKILFLVTTFFISFISYTIQKEDINNYTPFIDLDLLGSIEVGNTNYQVKKTLGEPLIIVKDYPDKEIQKYEYRYRNRPTISLYEHRNKEKGGLKNDDEYTYSEENNHNIFIHFKDRKVTQIRVDNISRKQGLYI